MNKWLDKHINSHAGRLRKPTIIQGFWHGPSLGLLREACLYSFFHMGHIFELYTYTPLPVPIGVVLKDAEEIIPFKNIFYYDNPVTKAKDLGPFSDLFRFKLLSQKGGWWSDVDTICLSPKIPNVKSAWAQELPEIAKDKVGTSQIAMNKGDNLISELYLRCLELSRTDFQPREALGPHLLSAVIREKRLPVNVFGSPDTFYPIRWIEMFKLWLPQFKDEINRRTRKSLFLPIYQSFPQYIGLSLGKLPPTGSYLAQLCNNYQPTLGEHEHYQVDEILDGTRNYFSNNASWAVDELRAVSGDAIIKDLGLLQFF